MARNPSALVETASAELLAALGRLLIAISVRDERECCAIEGLDLDAVAGQIDQIVGKLRQPASAGGFARNGAWLDTEVFANSHASLPPPDPGLVRSIIRQREIRDRHFGAELFSDPAWNMLLDLMAANGEARHVSVSSLCIASGAPMSTALRWLDQLIDAGLVRRVPDDVDRRRIFVELTERAAEAASHFLADLRNSTMVTV